MFILQTEEHRSQMMSPLARHVRIPQQKVAKSVVACCIRHTFTLRVINWGGFRLWSNKHIFNTCDITCYCKETPFIITAGPLALYWNHQRPPSRLVTSVQGYLAWWRRYSCGAARSWSHMCLDNFTRFFRFLLSYSSPLLPVFQTSRACRPWPVPIIPCVAVLLGLLLLVIHVVPLPGWYPTSSFPLRCVASKFLQREVCSCAPW